MLLLIIFITGLCVGSFLNVLIDRIPNKKSFIKGRSHCDHCKKELKFYDLIPVLSFIFLRGKSRCCHFPLSFQYPVVELLTGVLFIFTFIFLSNTIYHLQFTIYNLRELISYVYYLFIISALIVIFFTDIKYGIIPNKIVYPAILISLLFLIFTNQQLSVNFLLSALGASMLFILLLIITKGKGMGIGDIKLALLMGLILGFPKIITALYLSFLTGAIVSIILVVWGKKRFHGGTIPFGPFLVLGTIVSLFYGENLIKIFFNVFIP